MRACRYGKAANTNDLPLSSSRRASTLPLLQFYCQLIFILLVPFMRFIRLRITDKSKIKMDIPNIYSMSKNKSTSFAHLPITLLYVLVFLPIADHSASFPQLIPKHRTCIVSSGKIFRGLLVMIGRKKFPLIQ